MIDIFLKHSKITMRHWKWSTIFINRYFVANSSFNTKIRPVGSYLTHLRYRTYHFDHVKKDNLPRIYFKNILMRIKATKNQIKSLPAVKLVNVNVIVYVLSWQSCGAGSGIICRIRK